MMLLRRVRPIYCGVAMLLSSAAIACGSFPGSSSRASANSALVREQQRRIAAFDSVVRRVSTDSLYKLWHIMLTAPDIRKAQLAMMCETVRLGDLYGQAGFTAITRMNDTLFKHDDRGVVARMELRLKGESPGIGRDTCGEPSRPLAPEWLSRWYVPPLPQLPPSPDSSAGP